MYHRLAAIGPGRRPGRAPPVRLGLGPPGRRAVARARAAGRRRPGALRHDRDAAHAVEPARRRAAPGCGRPARCPAWRRRIEDVDEDGVGELFVRGASLCRGYWGRADAFVDADGWFATGDLASVADDGYVAIRGRRTELIITGGHNVYPAEVEAVLARHPGVAEVAVVGLPSAEWGETVVAFVVGRSRPRRAPAPGRRPSWLRSSGPGGAAGRRAAPQRPGQGRAQGAALKGTPGRPRACGSVSAWRPSSCSRRWGPTGRRP